MNLLWKKLYYKVQALFVFLQKKLLSEKLGLSTSVSYRIDLLKTIYSIKGSVTQIDAIIDVGANKGEFTQIFSHVYHPSLLICIEPNEQLNNDIIANNKQNNLIIINEAVSENEGEMNFYVHPDIQMSSLFPSNADLIKRDFGEDNPEGIVKKEIHVTTLNDVFEKYKGKLSGKSVFLKIDTQGNELEVLKGGKKALTAINFCLLEYMFQSPYEMKYSFEEIISLMSACGFSCLGPVHMSTRTTGEVGAVLFLFGIKETDNS